MGSARKLVWTNIDNRKYNTSKVIEDMKLA